MKKTVTLCCTVLLALSALFFSAAAEERITVPSYAESAVDLDLSRMTGAVVYAQIYQMAVHPEEYIGKIVRLAGWFDVVTDSATGMVYTVCYIPDASACCAQGVEFVWAGGDDFSRDYPQPGQDIIVTGRFETYFENDWEYMRLADAELIWSKE